MTLRKLVFFLFLALAPSLFVWLLVADNTGPVGWVTSVQLEHFGSADPSMSFLAVFAASFIAWILLGGALHRLGWMVMPAWQFRGLTPQVLRQRWLYTGLGVLALTWGALPLAQWHADTTAQQPRPEHVSIESLGQQHTPPPRALLHAEPAPRYEVGFIIRHGLLRQERKVHYVPLTAPGWNGEPVRVVLSKDDYFTPAPAASRPREPYTVELAAGKVPTMVRRAMEDKGLALAEPLYLATPVQLHKSPARTHEELADILKVLGTMLALKALFSAFGYHRRIRRETHAAAS